MTTKYKQYFSEVPIRAEYIFLLSAFLLVLGNMLVLVIFVAFIFIFYLKDIILTGDKNFTFYNTVSWLLLLLWGVYIISKTILPTVGINYYVGTILMPFILFQFIMNAEVDARYLRKLFQFLLVGGWILSIFSLYNLSLTGYDLGTRIGSIWSEINIMSEFYLILFMFSLSFLLHRKKGEPFWFYLISIILIGFSIFLTQTRGVWLGLLIAVTLFFIRKPKNLIIAASVVGILFLAFNSIIMPRVLSALNFDKDLSSIGRLQAWIATISLLKSNFLTGYGFDAFTAYRDLTYGLFLVPVIHSHNTYLRAMLEMGLIGAVLYFSFLFRAFYYSIKTYKNEESREYLVFLDGLKLSFISMFVTFMFEPYFSLFGGTTFAIWLLISVAFRIKKNLSE